MPGFKVTFFGVRGSHPVAGPEYLHYGGNTACLLCSTADAHLILDAGTGIINLGEQLESGALERKEIHLFISHFHLDHIQGLPFFKPLYDPDSRVVIYTPENLRGDGESLLMSLFNPPLSPIGTDAIRADLSFRGLQPGRQVKLASGVSVDPVASDTHPREGVLLFRVSLDSRRMVYATDVEFPQGVGDGFRTFCKGADVLVHDAQYLDEEYFDMSRPKKDFGHSTVTMAAQNAASLDVGRLFLFHYNPGHTDRILESSLRQARKVFRRSYLARENLSIEID